MLRITTITIMVAAAGLWIQSVTAAPTDKTLPIGKDAVAYGDLQLDKPEDAAAMFDRLDHAVVKACGGRPMFQKHFSENPQATRDTYQRCYRKTMTEALDSLKAAAVTDVWQQKNAR